MRNKLKFFVKSFATLRCSGRLVQWRNRSDVCIVGSGPAGFYTAQHLLKKSSDVHVDLIEKLPVPFGLIRYGVAPDHPEIKNVTDSFTKLASHERFSFYGNVNVGQDISISELLKAYNAVVLAYGASEDKVLGIPGEDLKNVFSARSFVGWYNGQPDHACENVDLDTDVAAVIGHGNVALDVARMLLRDIDTLKKTDVAEHALEAFRKSKVKRVVLIGRRGPLQVAFTIKELREMTKLPGCYTKMHTADFEGISELVPSIQRPKKRLIELLLSTLECKHPEDAIKQLELKYYRTPQVILPDENNMVQKLILGINRPEGALDLGKVVETPEEEILHCGLVIKSVGYRSVPVDTCVPFDSSRNIVSNKQGRAVDDRPLYCSGWLKTGPTGVIPSTMNSSFETAEKLLHDLEKGEISNEHLGGSNEMLTALKRKGVLVTTFDDWKIIDEEEQRRGAMVGKPREKICTIEEMLHVAGLL